MKHKIKYLWTILFLLISIFAYSQETDSVRVFSGTITSLP